jgi:hypothetical protein
VYDFGISQLGGFPADKREQVRATLFASSAPDLDAIFDRAMKTSSVARWAFTHGMYVTGTSSPRAFLAAMQAFNLTNGIAEQNQVPHARLRRRKGTVFSRPISAAFRPPHLPENDDEIYRCRWRGRHCEAGVSRFAYARMYDWLDETLSAVK